MPRVSVIIPTYNRREYVQKAIDSVLCQIVKRLFLLLTLILTYIVQLCLPLPLNAQPVKFEGTLWSSPEIVSTLPHNSSDPAIVADQTGMVHLFWSQVVDVPDEDQKGNTIAYSRWDGVAWSDSIDILVSPDGGAIWQPVAAVDATGVLHVIWASQYGTLYYSQAHISAARSARGWLSPIELAVGMPTLALPAALGVDSHGIVHVIYTSRENTREVMHLASLDGGLTWAWDQETSVSAQALFPPVEGSLVSGGTALTIDEADGLHVGWSMFNEDGFGVAIFYTQSHNGGLEWNEPFIVAEKGPDDYEADWLNIATVGRDTIMLVWTGIGRPPGRSYRYSLDGGQTWTPPTHFMEGLVGETESPRMVVDTLGTVHLLTPARRDTGERTSGTRYLTWRDEEWSQPYLIPGPAGKVTRYGGLRHTTTIRLGYEIFDAWYDEGLGEIWVVRGLVDAPEIVPRPFYEHNIASPEEQDEPAMTLPQASPTMMPYNQHLDRSPSPTSNANAAVRVVILGIAPAFLVAFWVVYVYVHRRRLV